MINGGKTEKVFNAQSAHGFGFNYAQLIQKEVANTATKGGLNNAKKIVKCIKDDMPTANNVYEITNSLGYGKGELKNKRIIKPLIIDAMQFAQQPKAGYINNRNLTIIREIEQTRKTRARHNLIGADPSMIVNTY